MPMFSWAAPIITVPPKVRAMPSRGMGRTSAGMRSRSITWALVGEDGDVRTELRRELADAEPGGEHGLAAFQRPASADDGIALAGGLHFRNPFPGKQRAAEPDEAFAEREHQVQGIDVAVHVGPDPSGNFRAEGDLGQHAFKFLAGKHGAGYVPSSVSARSFR